MKKKAKDLEFISRITKDGKGVIPYGEIGNDWLVENKIGRNQEFEIMPLSLYHDTFIANGINTYVVKLKIN